MPRKNGLPCRSSALMPAFVLADYGAAAIALRYAASEGWWERRVLPSLPLVCQTSALLMSYTPNGNGLPSIARDFGMTRVLLRQAYGGHPSLGPSCYSGSKRRMERVNGIAPLS